MVLVSHGPSCLCSLCIGEVNAWRTSGSIMMKPRRCANTPRHDQPKERLMSTEYWQPVKGYEGLYEVSNQGRVKSLPGKRWNGQAVHEFKGRILRLQCASRYFSVCLSIGGKVKCVKGHQLIADAFLSPCPGLQGKKRGCYHIDHINNDPRDNRASNLQWLPRYENTYIKPARQRDHIGRFV